jgi:hypothetical protein
MPLYQHIENAESRRQYLALNGTSSVGSEYRIIFEYIYQDVNNEFLNAERLPDSHSLDMTQWLPTDEFGGAMSLCNAYAKGLLLKDWKHFREFVKETLSKISTKGNE